MEGDDAAISDISLHIVHHILGSEPFGVVTCHQVPHDDLVGAVQPPVLARAHPSMRRTEEMGVNQLVRLVGVQDVRDDTVLEGSDVVEGMVAHLVPFGNDLIIEVMVAQYVLAHHEEGRLDVVLPQCLQDEWSRFWDRTIIKGEIDGMLLRIHSPDGLRIKPSEPFGWLLYKHFGLILSVIIKL